MRARQRFGRGLAFVAGALLGASALAQDLRPVAQTSIINDIEMLNETKQSLDVLDATIVSLNLPDRPEVAFKTQIPVDGEMVTLDLAPHSIRAEFYEVRVQVADGSFEIHPPGPIRTMRGTITEIPGATVAGSLMPEGLMANIILPDNRTFWVEPIGHRVEHGEFTHHAVYAGSEVIPNGGICKTDHAGHDHGEHVDAPRGANCTGTICVTQLACDADFEYFQDWGSVASVENRINSVINSVNNQYESQCNITHTITTIIVRTSEPDPYTSTNSDNLLSQFRSEWLNNQGGVQRDVAKLFTGKSIDGSVIGQAWTIGGICTNSAYCHSQSDCCGSFACTTDLCAHELGHLWGAFHCSCPSNTMNPSITCTNNFTAGSINSITSHRDSRTCLDPLESGNTSIPFFDNFPSTTLNASLWIGIDGATADSAGNGEPSAPNSLRINGSDAIRSAYMNASAADNITVSYWWQRTGSGNSPEAGEDLFVEYWDTFGNWTLIAQHPGNGSDSDPYQFESFVLPNSAEHTDFRIRFRGTSPNDGFDDFFIDDVSITADLALPGSFNLLSPANGATGVDQGPSFDWTDAANADGYTLLVDDDPGFGSPEINVNLAGSAANIGGSPLAQNTVYFWTVDASNVNGSTTSTPASYSFTTTGGGGGGPEIRLTRGSFEIMDGGSHDHGSTAEGEPLERAYRIYNDGTTDLTVSNLSVPAGYTITKQPPSPIAAGDNKAFRFQLDAASQGTFNGTVSFNTNDSDENPFNFTVMGTVSGMAMPPTARVELNNGTAVPDGSVFDYGTTNEGVPDENTFRIFNDGTSNLFPTNLQVPAGYTITKGLPNRVPPGSSRTIKIQIDAVTAGTYNGAISFDSNDPTSPYVINVTGEVVGPPVPATARVELNNGDPVADGSTDDLGTTNVGSPIIQTYRIFNDGDIDLNPSNLTVPSGYTITKDLPNRVPPGSSRTIKVRLDAGSTGTFAGTVSFDSNDPTSPYAWTITGDVTGAFAATGPEFPAGNLVDSAAADFNGNGRTDIMVLHGAGGEISFFSGAADGSLNRYDALGVNGAANFAATGDLNSDGLADAVVAGDGVVTILNNSNGVLGVSSAIRTASQVRDIALQDMNHDGHLDIVTLNADGMIVTHVGDGAFGFDRGVAQEATSDPIGFAFGYFTADASIDVAVLNAGGVVSTFANRGNGTLNGAVSMRVAPDAFAIASGRISNDLFDDVVVADPASLTVYPGSGIGDFGAGQTWAVSPVSAMTLADVTADGRADVIVSNGADKTVSILVADSEGFLNAREVHVLSGEVTGLVGADVAGDATTDVVSLMAGQSRMSVLIANADSCRGDVTGDGMVDLHDLNELLDAMTTGGEASDLNKDGAVTMDDLGLLLEVLGTNCN